MFSLLTYKTCHKWKDDIVYHIMETIHEIINTWNVIYNE